MVFVGLLIIVCGLASITGVSSAAGVADALIYVGIAVASLAGGLQLYVDRMTTLDTAVYWHPFTMAGLRSAVPWWLSAALAFGAALVLEAV